MRYSEMADCSAVRSPQVYEIPKDPFACHGEPVDVDVTAIHC